MLVDVGVIAEHFRWGIEEIKRLSHRERRYWTQVAAQRLGLAEDSREDPA